MATQIGVEITATDETSRAFAAAAEQAKRFRETMQRSAADASRGYTETRANVSSLSAQLNDIAVSLASGQSPFTVMLQQGSQISQALGPGTGLRGAVSAVGQAIGQMVSPVNLALGAVLLVGGAAAQYFLGAKSKAEVLDGELKLHGEIIKSIRERYGEAAAGAEEYATKSRTVLEALARSNADALQKSFREQQTAFVDTLGVFTSRGSLQDIVAAQYKPFTDAIKDLAAAAAAGAPGVVKFREAVAAAMNAGANVAAVQEYGRKLMDDTAGMASLEAKAYGAANAVQVLNRAMSGAAEFSSGLKSLGDMFSKTTAQDQIEESYKRLIAGATTYGQVQAANMAREKAYQQLLESQAYKDARGPGRDLSADMSKYYRTQIDNIEEMTAANLNEAQGLRQTTLERTTAALVLKTMNDLTSKANELGIKNYQISAAQAQEIQRRAEAEAQSKMALEAMNRTIQQADTIRSTLGSTTGTLFNDLANGVKPVEALRNAFTGLRTAILNALGNQFIAALLGGQGTPLGGATGGGILGSILAGVLHEGGVAGSGGRSRTVSPALFAGAPRYHSGGIAGLAPNEVPAILKKGEIVDPGDGSMLGGGRAPMSVSIDARGADIATVARIQRGLDELYRRVDALQRGPGRQNSGMRA